MLIMKSIKDVLDDLFYYLKEYYDKKKFPDLEVIYQFILQRGQKKLLLLYSYF
jgi:hypothetical protein